MAKKKDKKNLLDVEVDSSISGRIARKEARRAKLKKDTDLKFRESFYQREHLPTGNYLLDKAAYGGLPFGRIVEFYGGESSFKTTTAIKCCAEVNKINYETGELDLSYEDPCSVFFADMEQTADPVWEKKLGFDRDKHGNDVDYICGGDTCCDVVMDLINDDLYSLFVIDCTDQFYPSVILESEIGMNDLGLRARTLSKTMRKWQTALANSYFRNQGKPWRVPCIILLSHGRPIFMDQHNRWDSDAGRSVKFYCTYRIFLSKIKLETEDKADFGLGTIKATFVKNKLSPAGTIAEAKIALMDLDKLNVGEIDNVTPLFNDLKDQEMMTNLKSNKIEILGEVYKNQKAFKDKMFSDENFFGYVKRAVIKKIGGNQEIDENAIIEDNEVLGKLIKEKDE